MAFARLQDGTADQLERELLQQWDEEGLFRRTLERTAGGPPFVFYEGPPTANGRPGIHHVFARTIKDLICRFHSMCGRAVTRIAGWDTHGLPVEISVEQELDINGKADIEKLGIAEFNRRCRESVMRYRSDWESLSNRIGYWLDYDKPYITYSNDYIESVWWILKELWRKGLLYEGHKVLPYCSRCGTSLSSHELAMGYETHRSPSIYAMFRLIDDESAVARHLLVWTTTPWTLPSNIAIAVHPDFDYVEVEWQGRRIIVERTIAQSMSVPATGGEISLGSLSVVGQWKGAELVGLRYHQLLNVVRVDQGAAFRVVRGDFVTRDEGTGLVHMAPAFGSDDYDTIQREGLAFVNPVGEDGRFADTGWAAIDGLTVFEANDVIAKRLEDEGKVFGRYQRKGYEHSYPFCWRCDSPLIYYARRSWFVRTTAYRDRMVSLNQRVDWTPTEVGTGRFGEWLENNVDWALTRDRYWGTPLPAWVCHRDPDHVVVVGSFDELTRLTGRPLRDDFDPHRPFIDDITLTCPTCQGLMRRVPVVIDAWFDSGCMPYAQWHYPFENGGPFQAHFPADFICEGLDQTRGWFYSLLAIASGVSEELAYRHVIVNGLVLDADGRKMSKRLGNVVDPWDAVQSYGADAVRLYLVGSGQVWLPKRFDPSAIPEVAVGFLNQLRNVHEFFVRYADEWAPSSLPGTDLPFFDRWLLSRLDRLAMEVNTAWDGYDVRSGVRALMEFCDVDLANWYVRLNRARFWAPDSTAEPDALQTLYTTLVTFVRLLAPVAPFLTDAIHRSLTRESVHLAAFPKPRGVSDDTLNDAMVTTRKLVSLARNARDRAGLRVRQPLARMHVAVPAGERTPGFEACYDILKREVNVKSFDVVQSDAELVRLSAKPNYRSLGRVYQGETPRAVAAMARLTSEQLHALELGESATVADGDDTFTYRPEDVIVVREVASEWLVQSDGPYVVALDPVLTPELKREGVARELVNRVQRLRKDAGYEHTTRIVLGLSGSHDVLGAARHHEDFIAGETLARKMAIGEDLAQADLRRPVDIDGEVAVISMTRHERASAVN